MPGPDFRTLLSFQSAVLRALGLEGHHVTRVAIEMTPDDFRVTVTEVPDPRQAESITRVFELATFTESVGTGPIAEARVAG